MALCNVGVSADCFLTFKVKECELLAHRMHLDCC